jgi:hypothetical protein
MVSLIIIGVIVGVGSAFYFYGRSIGEKGNPRTIEAPGESSKSSDCAEACAKFDNARQMQCIAKADEAAAKSRVEAIRRDELAAIGTATSFTIAAGVALTAAITTTATIFGIPAGLVLFAVAASLFSLAAAAFAFALNFAGQLAIAKDDAAIKTARRQAWDAEVASARKAVHNSCTTTEANNCLSIPSPC